MADDRIHYLRDQAENDAVVKSPCPTDDEQLDGLTPIPAAAYDAARAKLKDRVPTHLIAIALGEAAPVMAEFYRAELLARCRLLEAERDKARKAALNEAAEALIKHADRPATVDGNTAQRTMRRHLHMAAQVIWNLDPPSPEEIMAALIEAITDADARFGSVPETPQLQAENEER